MIKEVKGDILFSKAEAIAHSIAPMDHFDSGLALSLREIHPSLYKDFRHYCHTFNPEVGSVWFWQGVNNTKIFNLLAQEPTESKAGHPHKATLSSIKHCVKNLAKEIKKEKIQSLALPKIATGVGGLDWEEVKSILDEHLEDLKIPIYYYTTYQKDVIAEE